MKLADIEQNPIAIEQGDWVDNLPEMGNLRVKVRGVNNSDWRRLWAKLVDAVPRNKREGNKPSTDELDRINTICLRDCSLIDWDGLDDGPYSKEMANTLLTDPKYRAFRDAVFWAATKVGETVAANADIAAKN